MYSRRTHSYTESLLNDIERDMFVLFFFFQAEDGIRDKLVTGVQTCALPISGNRRAVSRQLAADRRRPAAGRARGGGTPAGAGPCVDGGIVRDVLAARARRQLVVPARRVRRVE